MGRNKYGSYMPISLAVSAHCFKDVSTLFGFLEGVSIQLPRASFQACTWHVTSCWKETWSCLLWWLDCYFMIFLPCGGRKIVCILAFSLFWILQNKVANIHLCGCVGSWTWRRRSGNPFGRCFGGDMFGGSGSRFLETIGLQFGTFEAWCVRLGRYSPKSEGEIGAPRERYDGSPGRNWLLWASISEPVYPTVKKSRRSFKWDWMKLRLFGMWLNVIGWIWSSWPTSFSTVVWTDPPRVIEVKHIHTFGYWTLSSRY